MKKYIIILIILTVFIVDRNNQYNREVDSLNEVVNVENYDIPSYSNMAFYGNALGYSDWGCVWMKLGSFGGHCSKRTIYGDVTYFTKSYDVVVPYFKLKPKSSTFNLIYYPNTGVLSYEKNNEVYECGVLSTEKIACESNNNMKKFDHLTTLRVIKLLDEIDTLYKSVGEPVKPHIELMN